MLGIEKSTINSKKKGPTPKIQFLKMHLAVYPFEVSFLNNVDYQTTFYFQKNFQVIGQIKQSIPPGKKDEKYFLTDVINIVNFRLFSPKNVVYKWSVYRKNQTGEQEYLDTCTLNLREAVNSFILPQNNLASHSNSSIIHSAFIEKDMGLKFPRIGVILMFKLFVAADPKIIRDYVHHRIINKQDYILENIPTPTILNISQSGSLNTKNIPSKMYQKSLIQIDQGEKKKNNELNIQKFISQKETSKVHSKINNDKKTEQSPDQIQHLIMNFDANNAPISTNTKSVDLHQDSNHYKKSQEQEKRQEYNVPNLTASIELLNKISQGNVNHINFEKRTAQAIDFGVLKLQSDQGRINQEAIDKKLQLQQLQEIEEQRTSKGQLQTNSFNPIKTNVLKQKITEKKSHVSSKTDNQNSQINNHSNKIKKIVFIVILSILLFIVAATLSRNIHKKAHKKNNKHKEK